MDIIASVRNIRASLNISPAKEADLVIRGSKQKCDSIAKNDKYLQRLAKLNSIQYGEQIDKPDQSATAVVQGLEIFVPLSGLIDINKEINRLEKQIQDMNGRLRSVSSKLDNANFIDRAPEKVINHERDKMQKYQSDLLKLEHNLESLQS